MYGFILDDPASRIMCAPRGLTWPTVQGYKVDWTDCESVDHTALTGWIFEIVSLLQIKTSVFVLTLI